MTITRETKMTKQKILIAILSCHALRHYEQAQRDTWIRDIPSGIDYKFFIGSPVVDEEPDEVIMEVGDDLQSLTQKMKATFRWSLNKKYDFVFKCDLDTLVRPALLLSSGFENHDYSGGQNGFFASGGAGYWLSRDARELVVSDVRNQGQAEDVHTAQAVLDHGKALHADVRYKYFPGATLTPDTISYHLSSVRGWGAKYEPWMMSAAYNLTGEYSPYNQPRPIQRFRRLR